MYLLDTNVVSELRRPRPHKGVLNWIGGVPADRLFLSAVTVGELQAGIETARAGRSEGGGVGNLVRPGRFRLRRPADGRGRLPGVARLKHGKSDTPIEDAMIAATARVHRLTVATRNIRDFREFGVELFDPFDGG